MHVNAIARELDEKLKALHPQAATSLERLVREAIDVVEAQNGNATSERLPADFFKSIASEFGPEPFERPPQGNFEQREGW